MINDEIAPGDLLHLKKFHTIVETCANGVIYCTGEHLKRDEIITALSSVCCVNNRVVSHYLRVLCGDNTVTIAIRRSTQGYHHINRLS